jgi:hypothetical protein
MSTVDASSDHDRLPPDAPGTSSRVACGVRTLLAKWARNLTWLGYLLLVAGGYTSMWTSSRGGDRRYSHEIPAQAVAVVLSIYGLATLVAGLAGWALVARRPWRFSLRGLIVVTSLVAFAVAPVYHVARQFELQKAQIHTGGSFGPTLELLMGNWSEIDEVTHDPILYHDSYLIVALMPLLSSLALSAAIAALPLVLAAAFQRAYRWLHFRKNA